MFSVFKGCFLGVFILSLCVRCIFMFWFVLFCLFVFFYVGVLDDVLFVYLVLYGCVCLFV